MDTKSKLLRFPFPAKVVALVIMLLLFWPQRLFATDPLLDRLTVILNKAELTRATLHRIAVMANNEQAPGWDRVVEMGLKAQARIDSMERWVGDLAERFGLNAMSSQFPTSLNMPVQNVRILGRNVRFNSFSARFPSPPEFPHLTDFAARFLDLVENPLDDVLRAAMDLEDSMSTTLARVKGFVAPRSSPNGSHAFPEAEYNYGPNIRRWLGAFGVQLAAKELAEAIVGITEMVDAAGDQTFVIVGEGGNVKGAVGWVTAIARILTGMAKELIAHVDDDVTSGLVKGSYDRLEYIHFQVDTVDQKVEIVDDKVDTLTSQFNDWRVLSIRTRIEINLSGHGDHPHPIAIFQLPAQFGGYLELARDIVRETIDNMLAAGENIYQAAFFHSRGNAEFAAGRYKKAYDWYGKSYLEATK